MILNIFTQRSKLDYLYHLSFPQFDICSSLSSLNGLPVCGCFFFFFAGCPPSPTHSYRLPGCNYPGWMVGTIKRGSCNAWSINHLMDRSASQSFISTAAKSFKFGRLSFFFVEDKKINCCVRLIGGFWLRGTSLSFSYFFTF